MNKEESGTKQAVDEEEGGGQIKQPLGLLLEFVFHSEGNGKTLLGFM